MASSERSPSTIDELVGDLKLLIINADKCWCKDILAHDVGLLDADGQTELPAGLSEPVHQTLKIFYGDLFVLNPHWDSEYM